MIMSWTYPSPALANVWKEIHDVQVKSPDMYPSLRSYELKRIEFMDFEDVQDLHPIFNKKICSSILRCSSAPDKVM